ncbi:MAG: cytidylate kinase family protein [Spirochaetes bacterium]|nr:cytidylate kinase family protein [Spirochaetota bacterium]
MKPFIVAISGKSGCGNSTVSGLLAKRLGVRLVNYTFRNMSVELGMPFTELLDKSRNDDSYDRTLDRKQVELARKGDCVIGSRLALWLLPDADLRVYLSASETTRARRIRDRENGKMEEILAFTRERDCADHERYLRIYGIDNDAFSDADLIVNTEKLKPDAIVEILASVVGRVRTEA